MPMRVATFRNDHGIAVHRDGELAERSEVLIDDDAQRLGMSERMRLYKPTIRCSTSCRRPGPLFIRTDSSLTTYSELPTSS